MAQTSHTQRLQLIRDQLAKQNRHVASLERKVDRLDEAVASFLKKKKKEKKKKRKKKR